MSGGRARSRSRLAACAWLLTLALVVPGCRRSGGGPPTPEAVELRAAARALVVARSFSFIGQVERRTPRAAPAGDLLRFAGVYQAPDRTILAELGPEGQVLRQTLYVGSRIYVPADTGQEVECVKVASVLGANSLNLLKALERSRRVTREGQDYRFALRPDDVGDALGRPPEGGRYAVSGRAAVTDGAVSSLEFEATARRTGLKGVVNYLEKDRANPVPVPKAECRAGSRR